MSNKKIIDSLLEDLFQKQHLHHGDKRSKIGPNHYPHQFVGNEWAKSILNNLTKENNTMNKQATKKIELSVDTARDMYKKDPSIRDTFLSVFTDEELEVDQKPKKWEDLKSLNGYYIDNNTSIIGKTTLNLDIGNHNLFPTKLDALASLAEAQLRQLAKALNNGETEEEWNAQDRQIVKFTVYHDLVCNRLDYTMDQNHITKSIYFKRREDLEFSLIHHSKLWNQYFKLEESF